MIFLICIAVFILIGAPIIYNKYTGARYNSEIIPVTIAPGEGTSYCLTELVNCKTNADCQDKCRESGVVELECAELKRYNKSQKDLYGDTQSVCAPKKAKRNCKAQYGGLLAWTAFPEIDKMEWDCLCTYPNYASGPGCELNSDICTGGTFDWDVTSSNSKKSDPTQVDCNCSDGNYVFYGSKTNIPHCVPITLSPNFNKESTSTFYRDKYSTEGLGGNDGNEGRNINPGYRFQEVE